MKAQQLKIVGGRPASLTLPGGSRYGWAGQVRPQSHDVTVAVFGIDQRTGAAPIGSKVVGAGEATRIDDILPARSAGASSLRIDVSSDQAQSVDLAVSWVDG